MAYAQLETSLGTITLELYYHHAPRTCENFIGLVNAGYYQDTSFHRIIRDFMIQGHTAPRTGHQVLFFPL